MSVCLFPLIFLCPDTEVASDTGAQPLVSSDGNIALAVNGEIYNHRILRKQLKQPYQYKTHSDCEVIIPVVGSSTRCLQEED